MNSPVPFLRTAGLAASRQIFVSGGAGFGLAADEAAAHPGSRGRASGRASEFRDAAHCRQCGKAAGVLVRMPYLQVSAKRVCCRLGLSLPPLWSSSERLYHTAGIVA